MNIKSEDIEDYIWCYCKELYH